MNRELLYNEIKEKGCRLTPQRKIIMDLLLSHHQELMSVDALLTEAKAENADINVTTVYRNLELLTEMGLLYTKNADDGSKLYKLICHTNHHHHIICTGCGKMLPINYCPIAPHLEALVHQAGFTLEHHNLELYGKCADCQAAASENTD